MTHEQVRQSRIDTRRKNFDEYLYELANRPTEEDFRERYRAGNLRRALNNPPENEIWSGKALNDLLDSVQKTQQLTGPGPSVPVAEDNLRNLNFAAGTTSSGLGLLTNGQKLRWPLALLMSPFKKDRQQVEQLGAKAVQQAQAGNLDGETLAGLIEAVDGMQKRLKSNVARVEANQYIQAKRFLNSLEGATQTLQNPNVTRVADRGWLAQVNTVADLVGQMTRKGLRFAAASPGGEASYTACTGRW